MPTSSTINIDKGWQPKKLKESCNHRAWMSAWAWRCSRGNGSTNTRMSRNLEFTNPICDSK